MKRKEKSNYNFAESYKTEAQTDIFTPETFLNPSVESRNSKTQV